MPKYYLDSSENASNRLEDAIDTYDTLEVAQQAALQHATAKPQTIFYVREVIQSSRLVYKAEATLAVNSEVIDGAPE